MAGLSKADIQEVLDHARGIYGSPSRRDERACIDEIAGMFNERFEEAVEEEAQCSCGAEEGHRVDHDVSVPIEHPALVVTYYDGRQGFYDALDGWKIRDSHIVLGRPGRGGCIIPTAGNVLSVSVRRGRF